MNRPDWDAYFLGIAKSVAARADCTRRQVGAVLVNDAHRIISTGYNGAPPGQAGCATSGACPRGQKSTDEVPPMSQYRTGPGACIAVHAEANALQAGDYEWPMPHCTLYVTCEPCPDCWERINTAGVGRVVWNS